MSSAVVFIKCLSGSHTKEPVDMSSWHIWVREVYQRCRRHSCSLRACLGRTRTSLYMQWVYILSSWHMSSWHIWVRDIYQRCRRHSCALNACQDRTRTSMYKYRLERVRSWQAFIMHTHCIMNSWHMISCHKWVRAYPLHNEFVTYDFVS